MPPKKRRAFATEGSSSQPKAFPRRLKPNLTRASSRHDSSRALSKPGSSSTSRIPSSRMPAKPASLPASRVALAAGALHIYLLALNQRVRRILDHLVVRTQPAHNLRRGPIVFANHHRNQVRLVAIDHGAHAQTLPPEDQRGNRHNERRAVRRSFEVSLGQRTRQQFAVAVVHVHF